MFPALQLDPASEVPLYRQLHESIKDLIRTGALRTGERLPATRELAGLLGLNRATVSAAYALLESSGLITGHVGRGSFVAGVPDRADSAVNWDTLLAPADRAGVPAPPPSAISFTTSRPSQELFPLDQFRQTCSEVLASAEAGSILQLGSPAGYPPLRHFLLEQARREGIAGPGDDLLITNGCQQGLDLVARVLLRPGDAVAVEDPVYPGLKNLFLRAGARLVGVPMGARGIDLEALGRALADERPRLLAITSNFQNPTGATLSLAARESLLRMAREAGAIVVENDIYGGLRYTGEAVPLAKQLDRAGITVLLRSFSKVAFPGLRVGWIVGPRAFIARAAEAKQLADLHTDQLSQAVLLRFAASGRLEAHRAAMVAAGAERLRAVLSACEEHLPTGSAFTRPEGGMSVWVRLPEPLDAAELLADAHRAGVAYLPGHFFEVSRRQPGGLRLSFAGLAPEQIRAGLAILGKLFSAALERARLERAEPATVMV